MVDTSGFGWMGDPIANRYPISRVTYMGKSVPDMKCQGCHVNPPLLHVYGNMVSGRAGIDLRVCSSCRRELVEFMVREHSKLMKKGTIDTDGGEEVRMEKGDLLLKKESA